MSVRLNKLLAERGIGARRKCDELIASGVVRVNGKVVTELGTQVEPERDRIEVEGRPLPSATPRRTFLFNKPVGVISTLSDPEGRRSLREFMPSGFRLFPVGRLDADTSGLLLLTNDGELAHHLMHPRYGVQKRYRVHADQAPSPAMLRKLQEGIEFEPGEVSAPAQVWIRDSSGGEAVIELALHEGRHRQVRLMCEAAGLQVHRLHRWGYGPLRLGELERGMYRELSEQEIADLRAASARPQSRKGGARFTGQRSFERPGRRPSASGAKASPREAERGTPARGDRGGKFERPARVGRSERPARPGASDRPARGGRFERRDRAGASDRPARGGRFDRPARPAASGRPARGGRFDRPAGGERFDRPARAGASARPPRAGRFERPAGGGGFTRAGGSARRERPQRPGGFARPEGRFERPARGGGSDRPGRGGPSRTPRPFERFERRSARGSFERAAERGSGAGPERASEARPFDRPARPPRPSRPDSRESGFARTRIGSGTRFGPEGGRGRSGSSPGARSSSRGAFPPERARGGSSGGRSGGGFSRPGRPAARRQGARRPGGTKGRS